MSKASKVNNAIHCQPASMVSLTYIQAIIIGGGPTGLITALRLQQKTNIACTVYELRPEPTTLGGALSILSNGLRLLDRLGVYQEMKECGYAQQNTIIHSMRGSVLGEKSFTGDAENRTGYGYLRIKRTDLHHILIEASHRASIPIHYNKRVTSIEESKEKVNVVFSDGSMDSADYLFGCDGIHSAVRRLYVDPDRAPVYTGLAGIGGIMPTSRLSLKAVDSLKGCDVTMTDKGIFITTKCTAKGDEIYWGYQKETPLPEKGDIRDGWEVQAKEEVKEFQNQCLNVLQDCRGDWGENLKALVRNATTVKLYPIYTLPLAGSWSRGRVLTLGDAAHAMPPHAGQGVGMAAEDAFLLARILKKQDEFPSIESAFGQYEEIRRPRTDELSTHSFNNVKVRKNTSPWGLWLNEIGIYLYLRGAWVMGLVSWGSRQHHLLYDIEDIKI
jgi:2-polyprenyl-6-methoxyphenol hydroxylase-like FAD-dependent oxidoreductase